MPIKKTQKTKFASEIAKMRIPFSVVVKFTNALIKTTKVTNLSEAENLSDEFPIKEGKILISHQPNIKK